MSVIETCTDCGAKYYAAIGHFCSKKEPVAIRPCPHLSTMDPTCDQCANDEISQLRADLAAALAQIEVLVRDGLEAYEKISMLTIEEQKWRDSFFAAIAKRDAMRLALSVIAGDPCDEPYMDGQAPCGCCRSHIKTARRALDE